jgi:hypothetical protein
MRDIPYDRDAAVAYAHRWAFGRNPRYTDFKGMGGDCTNFASQVIYAGAGVMNYTPIMGWYYRSINDRAPAWTGVQFLYNFLTSNKGAGPVAVTSDIAKIMPGDVIQLSFNGYSYEHSPVVVAVGTPPTPLNVLVAAHEYDADNRPLDTYTYKKARFIHITHVRKP